MPHPKIWMFGATSIAGWNIFKIFRDKLSAFCPPTVKQATKHNWVPLNLEKPDALDRVFSEDSPEIVIYCAGVCDVDKIELDPQWAYGINVEGTKRLLMHLPQSTRLIYVSSDHVFGHDGSYNEETSPCPISQYGKMRVEAEKLILDKRPQSLIIRHSLALGDSFNGRSGHLNWLNYRLNHNKPVTIVENEARSVVGAKQLAQRIMDLSLSDIIGIRHMTSKNFWDRKKLALHLKQQNNLPGKLEFISRKTLNYPHLGKIELTTLHDDLLAKPLSAQPWI